MRIKNCKKHPDIGSFIGYADGRVWHCIMCQGIAMGKILGLEDLGDGKPETLPGATGGQGPKYEGGANVED